MSVREDQVQAAIRFLKNPSVADRSAQEKQDFLTKKGLTEEEVVEAVKRVSSGDSSSSGSSASASPAASTGTRAPATGSGATAPVAPPPATAAAPGGFSSPGGTLPGGYPAPVSGTPQGGYPAPAGFAPVPTSGYPAPWQQPPPSHLSMPPPAWPAPFPQQAAPSPWWLWLLGGAGFGSLLAFLINLLRTRRPRQAALQFNAASPGAPQLQNSAWPGQQHPQAWPVLGPNGTVHFVPSVGSPLALAPSVEPPSVEIVENDSPDKSVPRLNELAGYVRRHVEENREATSALRRTLEMQQRQYQTALTDFQRKVDEAAKRKPAAALPRMEIAPESMKMLKSLIHPGANGVVEAADAGEALRQWFSQVEMALKSLLLAAPCKAEAKKTLQTVSLIVSNLVNTSAQQEKYREVNTSSERFRQQLGSPDGGAADLLQLAGFDRRDTGFVFPSDGRQSLDKATRVRDFLTAAVRDSDQRWDEAQVDGGNASQLPSESSHVQEALEAPMPQRPPWASSSSAVAAAATAVSTGVAVATDSATHVATCGASAAPAAEVQSPPADAAAQAASSSSSASSSKVGRPPASAPWLSSALTRGLTRKPGGASGEAASESQPVASGSTAAAHPAESADVEETQRAPG